MQPSSARIPRVKPCPALAMGSTTDIDQSRIVGQPRQQLRRYAQNIAVAGRFRCIATQQRRSEEHTSELQSLMRISYAVFCLKKKKYKKTTSEQLSQMHTNERCFHKQQQKEHNNIPYDTS